MPATAPGNPQLEEIYEQMQARYAENLQQFKKNLPDAYEELSTYDWAHTVVDINDRGMTLSYKGQSIYPEDPWEFSEKQVENFILEPDNYSISLTPPEDNSTTIQDNHLRQMFASSGNTDVIDGYLYDRMNTPILACYGVGCGFYLEIMLQKLNLRHLIIYEADVELLLASLYCIDWGPIFDYFNLPHKRLDIFLGEDVEELTDATIASIRTHSTTFATQNLIFQHLSSDFYSSLDKRLREKLVVVVQGYGFYDDERDGLEHTLGNIAKDRPLFTQALKPKKQLPVFVVAAGPSLQNDIKFIQDHREQAIIFSCGSAIGALLSNGVVPDFHLEKERVTAVDYTLEKVHDPETLKKIHFIALNVVTPDAAERFASCSLMLKSDDFPSSLFPPNFPHTRSVQPMAANFGIACAIDLQFKDIYLFGVDMGMKDPDKHHVSGTVHDQDEVRDLILYITPDAYAADKVVQGNHGGEVFTNACYLWGVHAAETAAGNYQKGKIYNFSDGAKMLNTIPAKSSTKKLGARKTSKADMIEQVLACFQKSDFGSNELHRSLDEAYGQIMQIASHIEKIGARKISNREELISTLDNIYFAIFKTSHYFATQYLLGAVARVPLAYTYALVTAEHDHDKAMKLANECISCFLQLLKAACADLHAVIERHRPE